MLGNARLNCRMNELTDSWQVLITCRSEVVDA